MMEVTICFTRLSWYIRTLIKLIKGNKIMAKNKKYILFTDCTGLEYVYPDEWELHLTSKTYTRLHIFKKIFNIVSVSILFILLISSIILWITHKHVLNCLLPYAICFSVGYYIVNTKIE